MRNPKILVDTNVLIYAINRSSPKSKRAQKFIVDRQSDMVFAHQNVIEALRVLTHRQFPHPMKTTDALTAIESITEIATIISPTTETYAFTQALLKKYQRTADKVFDLYLVATMLSHSITTIGTDNERDFVSIEEIKTVNPFT